jgi:hypothetical protein
MMQRFETTIRFIAVRISGGEGGKLVSAALRVARPGVVARHQGSRAGIAGVIALVLLLSMTGSPASGQPRHQEPVGAKARSSVTSPRPRRRSR